MIRKTLFNRLAFAVLCVLPFNGAVALAGGPFQGFAGNWRGGGKITLTGGSQEEIRCRGAYAVRPDGLAMNVDLRCASDSYEVDIISNVVAQGSSFSGQWQETTRQVQGSVTGTSPAAGQIRANLDGAGFEMQFSATVHGRHQDAVFQAQSTGVQNVKISLSR